jgi:hypothetical protein
MKQDGYIILVHIEGDASAEAIESELRSFGLELDDVREILVAATQNQVLDWCAKKGIQSRTFVGDTNAMIADMLREADAVIVLSGGNFDVGSVGVLVVGAAVATRVPMSAKIL